MEEEFKDWHRTHVAIRFADIDKLGHVNNAKYLTYLESARISYFLDVMGEEVNWTKNGIILARAEINFALPVALEDIEVSVFTSCSKIGEKSFELSYIITKSDLTSICAKGSTTLVCYDYTEGKTITVPEDWRTRFEQN